FDVPVSRPPVITARIIADGPGATFLRHRCPQAGFLVCKFVDRAMSDSDELLWDQNGVYTPASISERRVLGDEQYQFAAAVLVYDPVGVTTAALGNAFQQLKMTGVSDFPVA